MRRRLAILGQPFEVEAEVAPGEPTEALFQAARHVSESITDVVRGRERARGRVVSCKEGCAACCNHLVPISVVEAVRLARVVSALPRARAMTIRRRFAEAIGRLERAGLLDVGARGERSGMTVEARDDESLWDTLSRRYRELGIPCPFLERQRCSIYEDRPLVCREYAVTTSAERCAHPRSEGVEAMPRPVRLSETLADVALALGAEVGSVPLVLTLEWAEHAKLSLAGDPDELTTMLLDMIEVQ